MRKRVIHAISILFGCDVVSMSIETFTDIQMNTLSFRCGVDRIDITPRDPIPHAPTPTNLLLLTRLVLRDIRVRILPCLVGPSAQSVDRAPLTAPVDACRHLLPPFCRRRRRRQARRRAACRCAALPRPPATFPQFGSAPLFISAPHDVDSTNTLFADKFDPVVRTCYSDSNKKPCWRDNQLVASALRYLLCC